MGSSHRTCIPCKLFNHNNGNLEILNGSSPVQIVKFIPRKEDLAHYMNNLLKIIIIQKNFRGYNCRKKILMERKPEKGLRNVQKEEENEIEKMVRYCNFSSIIHVNNILGCFSFSKGENNDNEKVQMKPPQKINNGMAVYLGEWSTHGNKQGKGLQIWKDGLTYQGFWSNDLFNGYGRIVFPNASSYEGYWKDGKANGYGVYYSLQGPIYLGYWMDDLPDGYGKEIWNDGSKYVGEFRKGYKSGKGEIMWPDGNSYRGEFKEGKIHGKGDFFFANGNNYHGEWESNYLEGFGVFKWSDGSQYQGFYSHNKKNGKGKLLTAYGEKMQGMWENGKLINSDTSGSFSKQSSNIEKSDFTISSSQIKIVTFKFS